MEKKKRVRAARKGKRPHEVVLLRVKRPVPAFQAKRIASVGQSRVNLEKLAGNSAL